MFKTIHTASCLGRFSAMRLNNVLEGFSAHNKTRLTFLSPRRSKPLANTPTRKTPFKALYQNEAVVRYFKPLSSFLKKHNEKKALHVEDTKMQIVAIY